MSAAPEQLTEFERTVLGLIVDGSSEAARVLQEQVVVAWVCQRTRDAGVWLELDDWAPRLPGKSSHDIANLQGIVTGQSDAELSVYFILHVREGAINQLEVGGGSAIWPSHPQLKRHWYTHRGRDGLSLKDLDR